MRFMNRIAQALAQEWQSATDARRNGEFDLAFHHLERAHILGQRETCLQVKNLLGTLVLGWLCRGGAAGPSGLAEGRGMTEIV